MQVLSSQFYNVHLERTLILKLARGTPEEQAQAATIRLDQLYDPRFAQWFAYLIELRASGTQDPIELDEVMTGLVRAQRMDPEHAHDTLQELRSERGAYPLAVCVAGLEEYARKRELEAQELAAKSTPTPVPIAQILEPIIAEVREAHLTPTIPSPQLDVPDTPPVPAAPVPPLRIGGEGGVKEINQSVPPPSPSSVVQEKSPPTYSPLPLGEGRVREVKVSVPPLLPYETPVNPHAQEDPADPAFVDFFAANENDDSWDLDDLDKPLDQPHEFVWDGLLTPGHVTLLHAKAKVGKSYLVFGLLQALAQRAEFLGRKTHKVATIYLTEESRYTLAQKTARFQFRNHKVPVRFISRRHPRFGNLTLPGALAMVGDLARKRRAGLVVIDTLSAWQGAHNVEGHAGSMEGAFRQLRKYLTAQGLAVLLLHHTEKHGTQARGSSAMEGAVDTMIRMDAPYEGSARRTLKVQNRISEKVQGLEIEYELTSSGFTTEVSATPEGAGGIWDFIPEGLPGVTINEVIKLSRISRSEVYREFSELLDHGFIEKLGKGARADPIRIYRKNDSSQNPVPTQNVLGPKGQSVATKRIMCPKPAEMSENSWDELSNSSHAPI